MKKQVKMFMMDTCPYCKQAFAMMEELKKEYPVYQDIEIEVIDENKELEKTNGYDYWYVSTFLWITKKYTEVCQP